MAFDPDKYLAQPTVSSFDPDAYLGIPKTPVSTAYTGPVVSENPAFGETGGGAATGRPRIMNSNNVQPTPRPLESFLAGATRSAIDPVMAGAQLVTGGRGGVSDAVKRLAGESELYSQANPASYIGGRIGGAVLPAAGIASGAGMIPSFARANTLAQGAALGATSGLITPIETGATGQEMYGDVAKNVALSTALGGAIPAAASLPSMLRGQAPNAQLSQSIQNARDLGYVIPPTQANPSMLNRLIEGFAGKISTAQNASAKNQQITNKLAAKSLGLPEETAITPQVLTDLRATAGQAYTNLGLSGKVIPDKSYIESLDAIAQPYRAAMLGFPNAPQSPVIDLTESLKSNFFDASSAVEKIRQLRTSADDAFRTGNTDIGRASKKAAEAIENALETHLNKTSQSDLLNQFRDARQLIAKTYTIEKAANTTTGTIDAKKLAAQLQRGKPLSGELKSIAQFSQAFPKASQTTESMGSLSQFSPLDLFAGAVGAGTSGGLGAAAIAARPALRAAALSSPIQNRLIPNTAEPFLTDNQRNLARLLTLQGVQGATNE